MSRVLRWLTGESLANEIAGDLEEERQRRGTFWFWSASLAIVLHVIGDRIANTRTPIMRSVPGDIRDAARLFRRAPLFGAGAVLTLALGTGVTAAILSLTDATLLRPLPIPNPDRVLQSTFSFSYLDFRDLVSEHRGFSQTVAWAYPPLAIDLGGDALQLTGAAVSGDYFALMGQQPLAGRLLNRGDDVDGAPATAVMSERLWTRTFRRDPQLIGKVVTINRQPVEIVGISPASFRGASLQISPELFVNLPSLPGLSTGFMANPATLTNRGRVFLTIAGHLGDGVSAQRANDEARRIYYSHRNAEKQDTTLWFTPLLSQTMGARTADDLRGFMRILLGASALTILLTCATVANLLLVRSERRRHELAVRVALGAGRARLCRLLLVESLGIGGAGGIAGVGVAVIALSLLGAFTLPGQISIRDLQLAINPQMCAVCVSLGMLTALLFGLAPIWQTRHIETASTLRSGTRATSRHVVRSTLVAVQISLCVLLLGGSLAFGRAIAHALSLDLGFNVTNTSITSIDPSLTRLPRERAAALRQQTLNALRARSDVRAAAWSLRRPMSGGFVINPIIEGREAQPDAKPLDIQANIVSDGYFDVMQIPVVSGRAFSAEDVHGPERIALVSAALAKSLWPDGAVLGRRLSMEDLGSADMKWMTVVGIVSDIHRTIGGPAVPMLYLAAGQTPDGFDPDQLVVRVVGNPANVLPEIRAVLRSIDPQIVITTSMLMTEHVEAPLMAHRLGLTLFLMFAGLAIALTGFGLYAVIAIAMSQRTREIGIRVALGAEAGGVIAMVLRQGFWPIGIGLVTGLTALVMSARSIQSFMFSLPAVNAVTVVAICAAIGVLASAAMLLPAKRALSVDPTMILRGD